MNKKNITLLLLLFFTRIICNGQEMDFEENLKIVNADFGTCYTIGNYMLCPEKKIIRVGRMFGTATRDCFGYFPDPTLKYDEVIMVIFAGQTFFDNSSLNIDWQNVKLLSYHDRYVVFTDGKILYDLSYGSISTSREPYNVKTYKLDIEKRPEYKKDHELTENFYVKGNTFYFDGIPILEPFDVANLRTIISKTKFETNYITDGKQVIFGGGKGGYSSMEKNGKKYVVAERWMIKGVDLQSLRILGRDLLVDKNSLYYRDSVIPLNKLNGLKLITREFQ